MACLAVLELTLHPQALLGWHNPSTGQSSLSPLGGGSECRGGVPPILLLCRVLYIVAKLEEAAPHDAFRVDVLI